MTTTRDATLERLLAELCRKDPEAAAVIRSLAKAAAGATDRERRALACDLLTRWYEGVAPEILTYLKQSSELARQVAAGNAAEFWQETPEDADRKRRMQARVFPPTGPQSPLGEMVREEAAELR
jgi:hypothetical protein